MSDPYIGQIELFAFSFAPFGWHFCDGTLMQVGQFQALYSLLSTRYGGDGRTTFGLPDLRGRTPRGLGQGTGLSPVQIAEKGGQQTSSSNATVAFTLVPANIPGHTHMATFTASTGNVPVNIPGTAGSGNITINPAPTIRVVPGSAGVDPAVNTEYYLTGVSSAANGPCTTTAPDTDPTKRATLKGLDVTVDASTYKPEIPPASTTITALTGGTVAVATQNPNPAAAVNAPMQINLPVLNPYLGLNYSIALTGNYPSQS